MADLESKLAQNVLVKSLGLKKGDSVVIETWTDALPYARTFVKEARRLGLRPVVLYEDEPAWWEAVEAKQLDGFKDLAPPESAAVANADGYVFFRGPGDQARLSKIPDKVQERATAYNMGWYKLAGKAGVRGCRMWLGMATDPTAEMYHVDPAAWRAGLIAAGVVEGPRMYATGKKLVAAVQKGSELRLTHPNGTDITIQLDGAKPRIDAGHVDAETRKRPFGVLANNPSGQVLFATDKGRANGTIVANRTIYVGPFRMAEQRFTFEDGRLTEHTLGVGADDFEKAVKEAKKNQLVQSYFSIGLNPMSRNVPPAEDTEEGGMTVGSGNNGFIGGKIGGPFLAPAMVGEGLIAVDGRPIAKGGKVLV